MPSERCTIHKNNTYILFFGRTYMFVLSKSTGKYILPGPISRILLNFTNIDLLLFDVKVNND